MPLSILFKRALFYGGGPGHACHSLVGGPRPPTPPRADTLLFDGGTTSMIDWGIHTHEHRPCRSFDGGATTKVIRSGGVWGGGAPPPADDMHCLVPYAFLTVASGFE